MTLRYDRTGVAGHAKAGTPVIAFAESGSALEPRFLGTLVSGRRDDTH